jgi:Domain of Unknown Function (DUF928)
MTRTKYLLTLMKFSVGMLLVLGIPTHLPSEVQAQPQSPGSQRLPTNWGNYQPPGGIDTPNGRESGGSRGPCIKDAPNYAPIALVPVNTFGTTLAARPTFLVYVPPIQEGITPLPQMQFTLRTAENQEIYKTTFPSTSRRGIVSFSLPMAANSPTLEMGKTYKWSFALVCNPDDPSGNKLASGLIQRVAPSPRLASELARASSPRDKAAIYAKHGIWYDAVSAIAELRRSADNEGLKNDWTRLLSSVELQKIADEPLIQSVAASSNPRPPFSRQR